MNRQGNQCEIRAGMVGLGMIFEETYRHFFRTYRELPLWSPDTGAVRVGISAVATRTGTRAKNYPEIFESEFWTEKNYTGQSAVHDLATSDVDVVCVATPDNRHFEPARAALANSKHVLIEKPSVLSLFELDQLTDLAEANGVLCKVVYHKLLDPDHKKLRTHVADGVLLHVNSGYCSLLEPKSVASGQFAEWVIGRNPATYVAVHYIKLIDFTFGPEWQLSRISASGQRGMIGPPPPAPPTWDSVLLRITYTHNDAREATFDIHTSWVNPDNFSGYVEQEVQFRFDNANWCAHQRKRGVEVSVEGLTPQKLKSTPNHHYNADFLEPWGIRQHRGYGIEVIERFFREVAFVEFGTTGSRAWRLQQMNQLDYNDIRSDRNTVAIVQALEAILSDQAAGALDSVVHVNRPSPGLHLYRIGQQTSQILYDQRV